MLERQSTPMRVCVWVFLLVTPAWPLALLGSLLGDGRLLPGWVPLTERVVDLMVERPVQAMKKGDWCFTCGSASGGGSWGQLNQAAKMDFR
jgi:hypothetical protein